MCADQAAIRREIYQLERELKTKAAHSKIKNKLQKVEHRIRASMQRKMARQRHRPPLNFDPGLPITVYQEDIIRAISAHQVLVIAGETGSGKSTQLPKLCLAAGRGMSGLIGCTQPRRIAATSIARRISDELGENLGKSIGFKIRFNDRTSPSAYIKLMTDGILLAEAQSDRYLNAYDTIIVDEAHERSLNIDFILGILKNLLPKRPDLKLIITSATIDTEKFSQFFSHAPVIEVSGRMYPVETRYLDPDSQEIQAEDVSHIDLAVKAVNQICQTSTWGDILLFMPTEQDIRETCELLKAADMAHSRILPLFARLSAPQQAQVFSQSQRRKIIVATNVAETSLTIPGIKYVVDSGLARISQYLPRTRTTALPVRPISRSSADQRQGRCGRVADGHCIRLFSEDDYHQRPLFTPPEILRANLADVILRMIALNLGDVKTFPFIDTPDPKSIKDGFDLLIELNAIRDPSERTRRYRPAKNRFVLTRKGRLMAKMPIDPRLSRMLIEAREQGCIDEMLVIASALSIQDPRERPSEQQSLADQMHARFDNPTSDFVTLINVWNAYHRYRSGAEGPPRSGNQMKKYCRPHFLSYRRMREWCDIHSQLRTMLEKEMEISDRPKASAGKRQAQVSDASLILPPSRLYSAIHKSILSGFISNIAQKKEGNLFTATKGRHVMIFPGSGLFKRAGQWIVAAEMIQTSRLFARTVANIDPEWIEPIARSQCKYSYAEPHWERKRAEVVAHEQVSLYGLIIIAQRKVSYGKIAPDEASELFIRQALVEGDLKHPFSFMQHNKQIVEDITQMEDKIRRRNLLVSEDDLAQFYKNKLSQVYDIRTLKRQIKRAGDDHFLRMQPDDVLQVLPDNEELAQFPDQIRIGQHQFKSTYRFNPKKKDDGITIEIPSAVATDVSPESIDWLVPGLLKEKIEYLIKGLPKKFRKQLVPVSETVAVIVDEMPKIPEQNLYTSLSHFIYKRFGVDIPAAKWPAQDLPDHLKMRLSITASNGREIRSGRNLSILQNAAADTVQTTKLNRLRQRWERSNITSWDFGALPERLVFKTKGGRQWAVFPGLEKNQVGIHLKLFLSQTKALAAHLEGVAQLVRLSLAKDLKFLKKHLTLPANWESGCSYFGGRLHFSGLMVKSIEKNLFSQNIRDAEAFKRHLDHLRRNLIKEADQLKAAVLPLLDAYQLTRSHLYELEKINHHQKRATDLLSALRKDLAQLVPDNFLDLYDHQRLKHLVRYIQALSIRAKRAMVNLEKDQMKAHTLSPYTACMQELIESLDKGSSQIKRQTIEELFWMIEEYKVSLFAQEIKTAMPVSPKRLEQQIQKIKRMI
jgi:ATP-dependent helicase HrpA